MWGNRNFFSSRQADQAAEGRYAPLDDASQQHEDQEEQPRLVWRESDWQQARERRQRLLADAQLAAAAADASGPLTASADLKVSSSTPAPSCSEQHACRICLEVYVCLPDSS